MNKSRMEIKFEGSSHQVSAELLILSLVNYQKEIEVANNYLGQGLMSYMFYIDLFKE